MVPAVTVLVSLMLTRYVLYYIIYNLNGPVKNFHEVAQIAIIFTPKLESVEPFSSL